MNGIEAIDMRVCTHPRADPTHCFVRCVSEPRSDWGGSGTAMSEDPPAPSVQPLAQDESEKIEGLEKDSVMPSHLSEGQKKVKESAGERAARSLDLIPLIPLSSYLPHPFILDDSSNFAAFI